VVTGVAMETL